VQGLFRGKEVRGEKLTTHPHVVLRLRKEYSSSGPMWPATG